MNFDWKKPLMLLAIVAALIASGCGGDDDESSDGGDTSAPTEETEQATGEPLSAEEYGSELGGILAPLGAELQEIGSATSEGSSNQDAIDGVSAASDSLQTSIDDLRALVPPEDAADAHEALISSLEGFKASADSFAAVDPEDEEAVQEQLTALQEGLVTFQTDFQAAITQLGEAGIQPPSAGAGN